MNGRSSKRMRSASTRGEFNRSTDATEQFPVMTESMIGLLRQLLGSESAGRGCGLWCRDESRLRRRNRKSMPLSASGGTGFGRHYRREELEVEQNNAMRRLWALGVVHGEELPELRPSPAGDHGMGAGRDTDRGSGHHVQRYFHPGTPLGCHRDRRGADRRRSNRDEPPGSARRPHERQEVTVPGSVCCVTDSDFGAVSQAAVWSMALGSSSMTYGRRALGGGRQWSKADR